MSILLSTTLIIIGLAVLIKGADVFVEQSSQIAKRLNVSERIIGLTLVAFGTSFPELSISVIAAVQGSDGLAIGNVVGSNVFNIAAVLGIIALVRPIAVSRSMIRKDIPMAILTAFVLLILLFDTIFTDARRFGDWQRRREQRVQYRRCFGNYRTRSPHCRVAFDDSKRHSNGDFDSVCFVDFAVRHNLHRCYSQHAFPCRCDDIFVVFSRVFVLYIFQNR